MSNIVNVILGVIKFVLLQLGECLFFFCQAANLLADQLVAFEAGFKVLLG